MTAQHAIIAAIAAGFCAVVVLAAAALVHANRRRVRFADPYREPFGDMPRLERGQ